MKKLILSVAMLAVGSAAFAQINSGTLMLGGSLGLGSKGGTVEVTGIQGAPNRTTDLPSQSNFNFGITGGYFLRDNFAVGATLSLGTNSQVTKRSYDRTTGDVTTPPPVTPGADNVAFDDEVVTTGFGIGLFANKYNDISGKWMWYYGATFGLNTGGGSFTDVVKTGPGTDVYTHVKKDAPSSTSISLGANLGVLYFLSDNWAFQAGLNNLFGLSYVSTKDELIVNSVTTTTRTSSFNLGLGTGSFGLGGVNVGLFYFLR
jgi:hypothetical protein